MSETRVTCAMCGEDYTCAPSDHTCSRLLQAKPPKMPRQRNKDKDKPK